MYGPEINDDECTADVGPFGFMGCTTKGCACEIKQAKHEAMVKDLNTPNFKTRAKHESMRAIGWLSPEEVMAYVNAKCNSLIEERNKAMNEATYLALAIYKAEYTAVSPQFELCDSVAGIISQIDNMYAGVRNQRDAALAQNAKLVTENEMLNNRLSAIETDFDKALSEIPKSPALDKLVGTLLVCLKGLT